ncbi:MAG: cation:proton antiporter [Gammaproteobacteria bacterium]
MQAHIFFLHLLLILLTARLFAEIASRLRIPAVVGEIVAGIVLGPSLFGIVQHDETIRLLAEIGIILLLFEVGLKTDARRLISAGNKSAVVAVGGFVMPFLLGFVVAYWLLDMGLLVSLFVGGTLTATSIGITVRVLADLGRQHHREGQIVLGAAVLDDIFGVLLLALIYEFSIGGGINFLNASKVLLFITIFFVLAPLAAMLMSRLIRHLDTLSETPGLIPTTIVSLVLFFALLAHAIGAPELLGGFAAGLALSRRFFLPFGVAIKTNKKFARTIERQMSPIISLFTPIFFVSVGLSLNLQDIDWNSVFVWGLTGALLVAAVVGKLAGALLLREKLPHKLMIGLAMIPRGEVGIVFAELGRVSGICCNEVYASLILVILLTTMVPPFIMRWIYRRWPHHFGNDIATGTAERDG